MIRTLPPVDRDITVIRTVLTKSGARVFRRFAHPTTGEVTDTDSDVSAQVFTWAQIVAEVGEVQAAKLRRLPYKLLGATNAEADAAIAAEDA